MGIKWLPVTLILLLLLAFTPLALTAANMFGDANNDGLTNISDAVLIINYIFADGDAPDDFYYSDVNGDCLVNISDAVAIVNYIFTGQTIPIGTCFHQEIMGQCRDYTLLNGSYLFVEVIGNDIHIKHINAFYNCCLEYNVEFVFDGNNITVYENNIGDYCYCMCYFDQLESVLFDMAPGIYPITLIGLEGDTVGVDSAYVLDGGGYQGADVGPCEQDPGRADYIYNYYNGTLTLAAYDMLFNCLFIPGIDIEFANDTIRFRITNLTMDFMPCMCYFDITAEVQGIPPGIYTAEVYQQNMLEVPPVLVNRQTLNLR